MSKSCLESEIEAIVRDHVKERTVDAFLSLVRMALIHLKDKSKSADIDKMILTFEHLSGFQAHFDRFV